MSDPQAAPPAAPAHPAETGFFGRAVEHIEAALPRAEHDTAALAAAVHAHAPAVFSVAGDLLPLLGAIDPANAAAVATAEALLPKVLAMINGATGLLAAAHRPPAGG
jgi:hypothetical protein